MELWTLANSLMKRPFDRIAYARTVDELLGFFSKNLAKAVSAGTNMSELPVFIAGMPRSGTTLVEQIIHAHPQAFGAGELIDIEVLRASLQERLGVVEPYPACVRHLTQVRIDEFADEYLDRISSLGGDTAHRVTNKSLDNYRNLGLVSLLLPQARVVYCRRDPMDNCLSIYMNRFHPVKHAYATDLADIGFVYKQSERIMEHWKEVLDLRIFEIRYEDLVADQQRLSRELIEFCGLEWDEECLRFHESDRSVMTLSYHQVSQPMYSSAVARYKNYADYIEPLEQALK